MSGHPLMTSAEVAEALRANRETVRRWRRTGKLTAIPIPSGHIWLYLRAEVEAILNGQPLTPEQLAAAREQALGGDR